MRLQPFLARLAKEYLLPSTQSRGTRYVDYGNVGAFIVELYNDAIREKKKYMLFITKESVAPELTDGSCRAS